MKRIAILGCENSHADAFLKAIREKEEFRDVAVVGVYSDEADANERLQREFGVPVMEHYADAVGKIDGLVITARHGANHYKYAEPYLGSGIPMFIDKPITVSEEEAVLFMNRLKESGSRISGGSSLKQDTLVQQLRREAEEEAGGATIGGYVRAPLNVENNYGGFYFYSQHLVEIVSQIFGRFPLSVTAKQNGNEIHVLFHYENYDCVGLYSIGSYLYYACRMAKDSIHGAEIPSTQEWFYREFGEFYRLLCGGEQVASYEEFIAPVFILNAIERSLKSGKEEPVHEIKL